MNTYPLYEEDWEIKCFPLLSRAFWILSKTTILDDLYKNDKDQLIRLLVYIQNLIEQWEIEELKNFLWSLLLD